MICTIESTVNVADSYGDSENFLRGVEADILKYFHSVPADNENGNEVKVVVGENDNVSVLGFFRVHNIDEANIELDGILLSCALSTCAGYNGTMWFEGTAGESE